jgi:hypothetical protein
VSPPTLAPSTETPSDLNAPVSKRPAALRAPNADAQDLNAPLDVTQAPAGGRFGGGGGRFEGANWGGSRAVEGMAPAFPGASLGQISSRSGAAREGVPPVLVEFSSTDPTARTALMDMEEDLAVMSRILDQALERGLGEEAPPSKIVFSRAPRSAERFPRPRSACRCSCQWH